MPVLTATEYRLLSQQGAMLLDAGRAREAEAVFRGLLTRMEETERAIRNAEASNVKCQTSEDELSDYELALTLGLLGNSLKRQDRAGEAEAVYRQELDILAALESQWTTQSATRPGPEMDGTIASVRGQTSLARTDLADVLRDQGRYTEARAQYEAALKIAQAINDERQQGVVLSQLGTLALEEGDFAEAERCHRDALARFHALGESRHEAIDWHQLGMVYQKAGGREQKEERRAQWFQQADEAYRQAMQLWEALGDQAGAAQTANNLAALAQRIGRPADAARWYRRALALNQAINRPDELARNYNNLAGLLLSAARGEFGSPPPAGLAEGNLLAEAESLARQAAGLMEQIGNPSLQIWNTYSILARIAEAKGDLTAARDWRRKERAAYVAFPGHWANLSRQYGKLVEAIASGLQGSPAALATLEQFYPQMLAAPEEWHTMPEAIRRLLAGASNLDALADEINLLRTQYLLLLKALEMVAGGAGATPRRNVSPPPSADEARTRALAEALQAWLNSPAGQSALRELQAQGLDQKALTTALVQRFMAAQAGGASPTAAPGANKNNDK